MSSIPRNQKHRYGILAFVIIGVSWTPYFLAKYDRWKNGTEEDMPLEASLAVLWLAVFLVAVTIFSICAVRQSEKRQQSPVLPVLAVGLNAISILTLVFWL